MPEKVSIRGFEVDMVGMDEALSSFEKLLEGDSLSVVVTANCEILNEAGKNEELAGVIKRAALVIPDGIGLVYAARIKGYPLNERVTGIDFSRNALELVAKKGKKVFFLGAKPGVAQAAAEKLMQEIEGLQITGWHDGYFKPEEEDAVVEEINGAKADFLCVALGSPKQELFMERHRNKLCCKVGIGLGGSLDVWSGNTLRAPDFYIDHGLEWLYRLKTEPWRFKRIAKIPFFLLKVLFDKN